MSQPVRPQDRSALQFERVWTREALFVDLEDEQEPIAPALIESVEIRLEVRIASSDEGRRAFVTLRAVLEPPAGTRLFSRLSAAVEGAFTTSDNSPARLSEFSRLQAPVLLLPYLRAVVSSLTAQTRLSTVVIPPLNMVQLISELASRTTRDAAPAESRPTA